MTDINVPIRTYLLHPIYVPHPICASQTSSNKLIVTNNKLVFANNKLAVPINKVEVPNNKLVVPRNIQNIRVLYICTNDKPDFRSGLVKQPE